MIASMTGFARREASGPWGTLVCELRSVNHRFLESGFRLPEELRAAESELRQALLKELKRGKVDCTLTYRAGARRRDGLESRCRGTGACARPRARALERACLTGTPSTSIDVLRWPGVIRDDSVAGEELAAAARKLFAETVSDLAAARAREGARLRELIEQRCAGARGARRAGACPPARSAGADPRTPARASGGAEGAGRPGPARAGARDSAAAAGCG